MRHILVHDYFQIDTDIVWDVIEHDLAGLKQAPGETKTQEELDLAVRQIVSRAVAS